MKEATDKEAEKIATEEAKNLRMEIASLAPSLGWSTSVLEVKIRKKYDNKTLEELSLDELDELIEKIRSLLEKKTEPTTYTLEDIGKGQTPSLDEPEPDKTGGGDVETLTVETEVDKNIRRILSHIKTGDATDDFYQWLLKEYGVKSVDALNPERKREVLKRLSCGFKNYSSSEPDQKEIEIEWDRIPINSLVPKLKKALDYTCVLMETEPEKRWLVQNRNTYDVTERSCECEEWKRNGSSLDPCKHMVRARFSNEEIRAKLKELGVSEEIAPAHRQIPGVLRSPALGSDIELVAEIDKEDDDMVPALMEIGKIRIGRKKRGVYTKGPKKGQEYIVPEKLDHFMIFTLEKDNEGWGIPDDEMNTLIGGEKCKVLDICLCYDDLRLNMPRFNAYFVASKAVCIHMIGSSKPARRTKTDGMVEEIECDPKTCEHFKNKKCRKYGRLSVIITAANRVGGSFVFRTHSYNSIRAILSSMMFMSSRTGGVLAGIPLKLRVMPMTVRPPGLGNKRVYVVNIEYGGTMEQLDEAAMAEARRRIQMGTNMKRIEAITRESIESHVIKEVEEDAEEIVAEFTSEDEENGNGQ